MPSYAFERLTAEENRFLLLEGPDTPMHVTGVSIHRAGGGAHTAGFDIAGFKRATEALLYGLPRYRRKLKWVPVERHPVWIDDPDFNLDFHVRHTALPRPGTLEQLKKSVARIMVQPLDLTRPLWETWIVDELEGDRFAVIWKVHHAMLDPDGADLTRVSFSTDPERVIEEAPPYIPRPEPSGRELWSGEWRRRLRLLAGGRDSVSEIRDESESLVDAGFARARSAASWLVERADVVPETPVNGVIGPHRRIDWLSMSLGDLKELHRALDCSLHDVVLAVVTGAVRRFLLHRHTEPSEFSFRVSAPVSVRPGGADDATVDDVRPFVVELPIGEGDPRAQVKAIQQQNEALKQSGEAVAADAMVEVEEWTPSAQFSRAARALAKPDSVNLTVTNVPGLQQPLYLQGCELLEWYGISPLMEHTGLSVSTVSYDGRMCWGINADRDLVPDLAQFVRAISEALTELAEAAGVDIKGTPATVWPAEDALIPEGGEHDESD